MGTGCRPRRNGNTPAGQAPTRRISFGADPRDLDQHAWYAGNASKKTHAVGRKKPNAWGLFDMHGNVAEWCNDFYDPDYYQTSPTKNPRGPAEGDKNVLRGGHWGASAESCSSAFRFGEEPGFSDACFARDAIGFRCVRKAPVAAPGRSDPGQPLPEDKTPENVSSRGPDGRPRADRSAVAANEPAGRDCLALTATGFVYGDIYLRHETGPGHPERPERLVAIVERLRARRTAGETHMYPTSARGRVLVDRGPHARTCRAA